MSRAKVISVYDGDTCTVVAHVHSKRKPYQFKCRLNGIDCAEIRGSAPAEKKAAHEAKEVLEEKILGQIVTLEDVGLEKYGRLLATIWFRGENVNQWMVEQRYAVEYDGGTKPKIDWGTYR